MTHRTTATACVSVMACWGALSCGSKQDAAPEPAAGNGPATIDSSAAPNLPADPATNEGDPEPENTPAATGGTSTEAPTITPPSAEESEGAIDFGVSDAPTTEVEVVCAAQSAASELRRVYLAFAVDVSASMWQGAQRFQSKWQPVIAASEAFFAEPDSAAISASLTFFPNAAATDACADATYMQPSVTQTPLPSTNFSGAIAALGILANTAGNAYFSSPTLAAFNGTVASLAAIPAADADSVKAVVLVTDGVPQTCANVDVQVVADAVRASGVRTYVVGVGNPPGLGAGDNLDNLNLIAEAGGTESAFIVQTGDPVQTQADFKAVIDGIRGVSVSCNIEIPLPPAGTEFIPEKVNVTYGSAGVDDVGLDYDADCASDSAWRYDDPAAPSSIVLCNQACLTAQRDAQATVSVEFGCERRGIVR